MTRKQISVGPPRTPDKHKHLVRLLQLGLFLLPWDDVMGDVASPVLPKQLPDLPSSCSAHSPFPVLNPVTL